MIVICPTINPSNNFAYVIEAKNYNNGVNDARRQLNDRVQAHIIPELEMNIESLGGRAAYAEIKLMG